MTVVFIVQKKFQNVFQRKNDILLVRIVFFDLIASNIVEMFLDEDNSLFVEMSDKFIPFSSSSLLINIKSTTHRFSCRRTMIENDQ